MLVGRLGVQHKPVRRTFVNCLGPGPSRSPFLRRGKDMAAPHNSEGFFSGRSHAQEPLHTLLCYRQTVCKYIYIYIYIYTHTHVHILVYNNCIIGVNKYCVCMYVFMYVCIYVCMYIHTYIYIYIHTYIDTCIYLSISLSLYIYIYIYIQLLRLNRRTAALCRARDASPWCYKHNNISLSLYLSLSIYIYIYIYIHLCI